MVFKKILFILILPFFLHAQWTDPRPKSIQLWHLNTSFFDSLGNTIADSLAALSADGVTIVNDGVLKQKVFTSVAALEAASASTVGMTAILTNPVYAEMVYSDSLLPEEGGIAYNASTQGKQWISSHFLRTNEINTREFGLSSSNTAIQNNTAFQNVFDFVNALSDDSVTVFIPDGRYEFSTKFVVNRNGEMSSIIKGGSNTVLVQTGNDTLLATDNFFSYLTLENIRLVGNGKGNSSVGISVPDVSGAVSLTRVSIDSFNLGMWAHDLTKAIIQDVRFRRNHIGGKFDFNIDGWTLDGLSQGNDTAFVVTGGSNDYVQFTNWVSAQDSVWIVFSGGGGFGLEGGYFEDVKHLGYIGSNDGNNSNGLRNISLDGWVYQGTATSGFVFYDNDIIDIENCRITGLAAAPFFDVRSATARVTTTSNYFSGSNMLVQHGNSSSLQYTGQEGIALGQRSVTRYNVNGLGATPVQSIEVHSVTDTSYIFKYGRTGSTGRTFASYMYLMANPTTLTLGMEGTSYWDFNGGYTGNPPTASAKYRGHLLYKSGTIDIPYLGMQYGTGKYKWFELLTGKPYGEGNVAGQESFFTTAIHDTVLITGVHPDSDYVYITPITNTPSDTSSVLSYTLSPDTLFVHRQTGAISGLLYVWRRIKNRLK